MTSILPYANTSGSLSIIPGSINANSPLVTNGSSQVVSGDMPSYAQMYISGNTSNTTTTAGSYTPVTYSSNCGIGPHTSDWTLNSASTGILEYTGSTTRNFNISYSAYGSCSVVPNTIYLELYINSSLNGTSICANTPPLASVLVPFTSDILISVAPNTTIQLYETVGTTNCTVNISGLTLYVMSLS